MDTKTKPQETRETTQAARIAFYHEQKNIARAARLALQRVFEREDATPEEILRAGELLAKLSGVYRF